MSLAHALKTAIAIKGYNDEVEAAAAKKKQLKEKSWDIGVLDKGGVTWWVRDVEKEVGGKVKIVKQKVKVVCIPDGHDDKYLGETKGKFSFRNGSGNRVYLSVKSYRDANEFVSEVYSNGRYRVSNFA